jgi:glycosyltransferase involved in cell wall biosynthesis
MTRMRVAHLESGMHLYGGAAQVLYLIEGLAAKGIDNVLLCARGSAIARAADHCTVIELPMAGDLDIGLVARCRSVLETLQVDLLHVHSRRGADAFGGRAAEGLGIPAVISRRVDNVEPAWLAQLRFRPYAAVIAISQAIRQVLETQMGIPADKLTCVPDAVDTQRFQPASSNAETKAQFARELGVGQDHRLIGVVAQFIPRKGHANLLAAFAALKADDVALVCFGQGPLESKLRAQASSLGIERRVFFAGFRDDMQASLPMLTLLVHPAHAEGMGVAVLEAQACGIPVIASAVGGIPEVIRDGATGVLVPPGNTEALTHALASLLSNPQACAQIGAAGRTSVERGFSTAAMVNGNLAVYHQVLGEAGD